MPTYQLDQFLPDIDQSCWIAAKMMNRSEEMQAH
jgi:hypothetical protein